MTQNKNNFDNINSYLFHNLDNVDETDKKVFFAGEINDLDKKIITKYINNTTRNYLKEIFGVKKMETINFLPYQSLNLDAGKTYGTTFNEMEKTGSTVVISVLSDGNNAALDYGSDIIESFENAKKAVEKFVKENINEYFNNEILLINEEFYKKLTFKIETISGKPIEKIKGDSFGLPFAMAILSRLLNFELPPDIGFSGGIKPGGELTVVNYLNEKLESLTQEFDSVKRFAVPSNSDLYKDGVEIIKCEKLKDIIAAVFPDRKLPECKFDDSLTLRATVSQEECKYKEASLQVKLVKMIGNPNLVEKVFPIFIDLIEQKFQEKDNSNIIVFNNVRPGWATAMIAYRFKNNFNVGFYNTSSGYVITGLLKGENRFSIGDIIPIKN